MKKQTIIEKYQAKFDEIKTTYNERMAKMQEYIESSRARIDAAQEDLQKAIDVEDAKAYQIAQSNINEAESTISMYTIKMEQERLKGEKYSGDSATMLAEVTAYETKLYSEYEKKAESMMQELMSMHDDFENSIRECEELLKKWSKEIYEFDRIQVLPDEGFAGLMDNFLYEYKNQVLELKQRG